MGKILGNNKQNNNKGGIAMAKGVHKLQKQARGLIKDSLKEAVSLGHERDWDCSYKAKRLLQRLEPLVFAYAPLPDRVVNILKDKGMLV